ncbi:hypothetical protein K7711_42600 [Nocardia sp. CA2R105]|uniref:VOC family protein n=1 Tax=Nocardia coffeae TaxID=2873381 RepID=UPI001CA7ABEC|nr:VOC family protein [Nocardia coffeae]MBY8863220.1 hypothetical protein [Nocardia coffeae]
MRLGHLHHAQHVGTTRLVETDSQHHHSFSDSQRTTPPDRTDVPGTVDAPPATVENWPGNQVPKQMHLDLFVADLDGAEQAAVGCGAVKADFQPAPDRWRVLIDPSGHPFCLTVPPGAEE